MSDSARNECEQESFTSFADRIAAAPIGTLRSSARCTMSVGTSILFRSSVKSVSDGWLSTTSGFSNSLLRCRFREPERGVRSTAVTPGSIGAFISSRTA
jgi:hypothetical protein